MEINIITTEELQLLQNEIKRLKDEVQALKTDAQISVYSNATLATLLGVTPRTLQNYRDESKIEFSQIGKKIFYTHEQVNDFLKKNKIGKNEGRFTN